MIFGINWTRIYASTYFVCGRYIPILQFIYSYFLPFKIDILFIIYKFIKATAKVSIKNVLISDPQNAVWFMRGIGVLSPPQIAPMQPCGANTVRLTCVLRNTAPSTRTLMNKDEHFMHTFFDCFYVYQYILHISIVKYVSNF